MKTLKTTNKNIINVKRQNAVLLCKQNYIDKYTNVKYLYKAKQKLSEIGTLVIIYSLTLFGLLVAYMN